mgnify:CR=1 FL=1
MDRNITPVNSGERPCRVLGPSQPSPPNLLQPCVSVFALGKKINVDRLPTAKNCLLYLVVSLYSQACKTCSGALMTEKDILVGTIQDFCRQNGLSCSNVESGLLLQLGNQSVSVAIRPIELQSQSTEDLVWEVIVFAEVGNPVLGARSPAGLGVWNRYATLLSTVAIDDRLIVFSKFAIYRNSREIVERIYSPLASVAIWLAFGQCMFLEDGDPSAQQFLRGDPIGNLSHWLGITNEDRDRATFITPAMFDEAATLARDRGLVAFSEPTGFSCEFPWDPGASSALIDDGCLNNQQRTSLILIENDVVNPLYGKGVLARIQFKLSFDDEYVAELVNALNRWELDAVNLPPFFGSWCIDAMAPSPAFVAFFPSVFSNIATPVSILSWAWGRHQAIREMMYSDG